MAASARQPLCFILAVSAVVAWAAGCEQRESVTRYTVDKPPALAPLKTSDPHAGLAGPTEPGEAKDRTLGAIVPNADEGWFFKLTGPKDAVAAQTDAFHAFLKSVRFNEQGKPQWTLADGWQERPGSDIRYATLILPGAGKPLELTVTALRRSGDDAAYALVNINRWRGQLQLPPISADRLADESTQVTLAGATATVVDLVGTASSAGMGRPPFMSRTRDGN
jgi:hypothetical protein